MKFGRFKRECVEFQGKPFPPGPLADAQKPKLQITRNDVIRNFQERNFLFAKANGRRPVGRPRTRCTDYIEDLGWNRLGLRPSEMMEVMEDREVWRLNLELLPPQPSWKSGQRRKKKKFFVG